MARKLEGKVAVVTGGSAGIELATAKRFAEEGAYVFITGRRQPELDAAVKEIGTKAVAVRADSSDIRDLVRLFGTVKAAKGRIDVLFANAGVYEFTPFGTITEDAYDKMFDQRQGRAVHGAAGGAADGGWRLDHTYRIGCGFEGI